MEASAIVLLGSHGAGKDTIAQELIKRYPGKFYNAKFSSLIKLMVSSMHSVKPQRLEDKEWRNKKGSYGVAPISVLNALFFGLSSVPEFTEVIVSYCLDNIPEGVIPIFTDIRRDNELKEVLGKYGEYWVEVYRLYRFSATPDETDTLIEYNKLNYETLENNGTIDEVVTKIAYSLSLNKVNHTPTIHMYYDTTDFNYGRKPPLLDFLNPTFEAIVKALRTALPDSESKLVLELAYTTINEAMNLGCKPVISEDDLPLNSYVIFNHKFPLALVNHLRSMANLVWHVDKANYDNVTPFTEGTDELTLTHEDRNV